jgi:hypothetical protein
VAIATEGLGVDDPAATEEPAPRRDRDEKDRKPATQPPLVRPRIQPRPSPAASYQMSRPEDWAFAGVVTAAGVALGAAAAWLLGTNRRT